MALTFPYPLAFLSHRLAPRSVGFSLMRNDEMSGSGSGQFWSARLATPIWQVALDLNARYPEEAREIDAKIMALDGSAKTFLFADPGYRLSVDPGAGVTLSAIAADRTAISLAGLPPGYVIRAGQRLSIAWGTDRYFFATFGEGATANASGATGPISIMPYLPLSISAGVPVELAAPVLKVFVPPGGHTPFVFYPGDYMAGGTLSLLQKV